MKDELVKKAAQKTNNRPRKKVKGQEAVQDRLWEFMVNGRTGRSVEGFSPSPFFGCSEKE